MARTLRIVEKPKKLERPMGTSIAFVAHVPKEEHLRFRRQHDRTKGDLDRSAVPLSWLQIMFRVAATGAGLAAAAAMFW